MRIRAEIIKNWDPEEEDYCYRWFGSNYLGHGKVLCGFCKKVPVDFVGWIGTYACPECQKEFINKGTDRVGEAY